MSKNKENIHLTFLKSNKVKFGNRQYFYYNTKWPDEFS